MDQRHAKSTGHPTGALGRLYERLFELTNATTPTTTR